MSTATDQAPEPEDAWSALPLIVLLAAFFLAWTLRATWLYAVDESIASPVGRALYSNLVKFLVWVVPALAFARRRARGAPARSLGLSVLPTVAQWASCALVTAVYLIAVAAFERVVGGKTFSLARLEAMPPPVLVLSFAVTPLLEEILFRGLLLKELLHWLRRGAANLVASLLFVAVHLPFWLSHDGLSPATGAKAVGVFGFSLLAGWLFSRTASVWPPTAAHALNNLLASLLR